MNAIRVLKCIWIVLNLVLMYEYIHIDLQKNTNIIFIFLYLSLYNNNDNDIILTLYDTLNNVIEERIVENIVDIDLKHHITFNFTKPNTSCLDLNTVSELYKSQNNGVFLNKIYHL